MTFIFEIIFMCLSKFSKFLYSFIPEEARPPDGLLQKLKQPLMKIVNKKEKPSDKIKREIIKKILKVLMEVTKKTINVLVQIFKMVFLNEIGLGVLLVLVVGIAMYSLLGLFGAYQGKINVDIAQFEQLNRDDSIYQDAQNTNELRKAYFEYVSYTGFYQTFNLRDMNPENINPFKLMVQAIVNDMKGYDDIKKLNPDELNSINKEIVDGQAMYERGIMGLLGLDPRYIYTDANKNPLKYLKSAMVVGKGSENGKINAYFRDYFNKESAFMLSESLLSEMNRLIYGQLRDEESITYPEAFVKPLHFVNDFMRIDDQPDSSSLGTPYVYVTKRVKLEDIRDARSEFYNRYEVEGMIYSKPSHIVYDYAVIDKNIYLLSNDKSDSAKQINIGNTSKYAELEEEIEYSDGTSDTKTSAIKLYWKVKDSDNGDDQVVLNYDWIFGNETVNPYNFHMGVPINNASYEQYFDGPYLECDENGNLSNKISENSYEIVDGQKIKWEYNKYPNRHLQLAPILDSNGDMQASSRMLFNKTFVQKKSIKESYRNFPEYYTEFSKFVDIDLGRSAPQIGMSFDFTDTIEGGTGSCSLSDYIDDEKKDFQNRKCSIIRKHTGVQGYAYLKAKFAEMGAMANGGEASDAEIDISSAAMLYILLAFEDYLIDVGEYGVVWEYKYYTASEFDVMAMKMSFMDIYGIKETFVEPWSDEIKYKYPMDTIKFLDNKRTFSTEFVPVAEISGTGIKNGDYDNVNMNDLGYGWRLKDSSGTALERVAGEASLQMPEYYDGGLKSFFEKVFFGAVSYGKANFAQHWNGGEIEFLSKDEDMGFDDELKEELSKEKYSNDYRNKDLVWNDNVDVYVPSTDITENQEADMVKASFNGRVTYSSSPENYLPMELNSVRDYGLGSVLSYIESRKVVFKSGAFMDESYNANYVGDYFKEFSKKVSSSSTAFTASDAKAGFYPKEIIEYDPAFIGNAKPTRFPIENLQTVANGILQLQYAATEEEMEESDNRLDLLSIIKEREANGYKMNGLDLVNEGFVFYANAADTQTVGDFTDFDNRKESQPNVPIEQIDFSKGGVVRAFSPYLKDKGLNSLARFFFGSNADTIIRNYGETQFLDPLQYYLEWFDHLKTPDDIFSKLLSTQEDSKLVTRLDNEVAAEFRKRQSPGPNEPSGFEKISNQSKYLVMDLFDTAGTKYVPRFKEQFYAQYLSAMQPFDLIDRVQTQKIYMVEEAVTFIGTFNYTYKDEITDLGQISEKQIIDLIFADRYYYLSHYIMAQGVVEYVYDVKEFDSDVSQSACDGFDATSYLKTQNNFFEQISDWINKKKSIDAKCLIDSRTVETCVEDTSKESKAGDGKSQKCTSETFYDKAIVVTSTKPVSIDQSFKLDTYEELKPVLEKLPAETANKLVFNTKIYQKLDSWFPMFDKNKYGFSDKYVHDYGETQGDTDGDNDNHYDDYNHVWKALNKRSGYVGVGLAGETLSSTNMPLDQWGNIDDLNLKVDLNEPLKSLEKLSKDEQNLISKAIYDIHGSSYKNTTNESLEINGDWSIQVEMGTVLNEDSDYTLYGIQLANRADYGFPIPVFRHYSGKIRQILPTEKGAYINGETIDSWTERLVLEENATFAKNEAVQDEKEAQQAYLYDYMTNFETYIPYNVKSDYDLLNRGRDPYHSILGVENSTVSNTATYTSDILNQLKSEAWIETLEELKKSNENISDVGIAQNIAGIIETAIQIAPERMIKIYNTTIADSNSKIEVSNDNIIKIRDALKSSIASKDTSISNKVSLKTSDNNVTEVQMLYFGSGAIFADLTSGGSVSLSTANIGSATCGSELNGYTNCFNDVSLSAGETEERNNHTMALQYVTTSVGKLIRKYGNVPKAIHAYFYGENFTDAMISVASNNDWLSRDSDDLIAKALAKLQNNPSVATEDIEVSMYSSSVITKSMSYVSDIGSRSDMTAGTIPPDITGGNNQSNPTDKEYAKNVYARWKAPIDAAASKYNVDVATLVAMITRESGGNHLAGLCGTTSTGDGGVNASNWQTNRTCANPRYNASSPHKAFGLGQLLDSKYSGAHPYTQTYTNAKGTESATFYKYDGTNLPAVMAGDTRLNPENSVMITANIMAGYLAKYDNNMLMALGAYGIGPGAMNDVKACMSGGGDFNTCFTNRVSSASEKAQLEVFNKYYVPEISSEDVNISAPDGTGTGTGSGLANSGNSTNTNAVADIGRNYFNRDLFTFQNSGVELFIPNGRLNVDDVDLILVSATNYGKNTDKEKAPEFNPYRLGYGIMDLFTKKTYSGLGSFDSVGNVVGGGETWIGMDANLISPGPLGGGTVNAALAPLYNMPPLFPFSNPLAGVAPSNTYPFGISSKYLAGVFHYGYDFSTPLGTKIYAVAPGRVTNAKNTGDGFGNLVIITHSIPSGQKITSTNGTEVTITEVRTFYAHNSSLLVSNGDIISEDCTGLSKCRNMVDPIALAGSTGNSTGNHLHLEIRVRYLDAKGTPKESKVDPSVWLFATWASK